MNKIGKYFEDIKKGWVNLEFYFALMGKKKNTNISSGQWNLIKKFHNKTNTSDHENSIEKWFGQFGSM